MSQQDFWGLSDGSALKDEEVKTSFESGGGAIELIPNDTTAQAIIEEAKWDKKGDGADAVWFISLKWKTLKPEEIKSRVVFQKIWARDLDPSVKDSDKQKKKLDKAKRMLAAIDANCGGKLRAKGTMPSDADLMSALAMKPMMIKIFVWTQKDRDTGNNISGNWVGAVGSKDDFEIKLGTEAPPPSNAASPSLHKEMNDDLPF